MNLRGLGEGTTLVLLNGRRLPLGFVGSAVDISAIPLSALESVEILPDGASAIYGSDAIGGVVNFNLRKDFSGAETRLKSGMAPGGLNEYRATQTVGKNWQTGNVLLAGEYYHRDILTAKSRSFVPANSTIGSLTPRENNLALILAANQELSDTVSISTDALWTKRNSFNRGGRPAFNETAATKDTQFSANLQLNWKASANWEISASASYAQDDINQTQTNSQFENAGLGDLVIDTGYKVYSGRIVANGRLFELPGGSVRIAIGGDIRREELNNSSKFSLRTGNSSLAFSQTVSSAFAESYLPIISTDNSLPLMRSLELSLAVRFDHYSTFGSSVDPKIGVMWEPIADLRLRGSFGTSYRAPRLSDYSLSQNSASSAYFANSVVPDRLTHILGVNGSDVGNFKPEKSRSFVVGAEAGSREKIFFSASYYNIKFKNRIALPNANFFALVNNPSQYPGLVILNPTVSQVNSYIAIGNLGSPFLAFNPDFSDNLNFDPSSIDVIVDQRRRNVASTFTDGIDVETSFTKPTDVGTLTFGLSGTYIFNLKQVSVPGAAAVQAVDTYYNPANLRLRGSFGWDLKRFSLNAAINYVDGYKDNRREPVVGVGSFTTVDARLAYTISDVGSSGRKITFALSAQNLLNQAPPQTRIVAGASDAGFDPTNSNPLGRLVALEVSAKW